MNTDHQARFDSLYEQHLRALKRHGKAAKTIEAYGLAVRRLAQFVDRCPDDLTSDELNAFFEWLIDTKGWSTVKLDRNGIRFFYEQILGQSMPWLNMVRPPKIQALPDVLTIEEIARIIHCTRERRYKVFWLATYSMGLRLGETMKLEIADIDSAHMRVHVRLARATKIASSSCRPSRSRPCAVSGPNIVIRAGCFPATPARRNAPLTISWTAAPCSAPSNRPSSMPASASAFPSTRYATAMRPIWSRRASVCAVFRISSVTHRPPLPPATCA